MIYRTAIIIEVCVVNCIDVFIKRNMRIETMLSEKAH